MSAARLRLVVVDLHHRRRRAHELVAGPESRNSLARSPGCCNCPAVQESYFGKEVAAGYDASFGPEFDRAVIARTVDVLTELAGDGAALEFAVGTGRVALPL